MLSKIFLVIGLVLVVEGSLWLLFPRQLKKLMEKMTELRPDEFRWVGFLVLAVGFVLLWLVKDAF